MKNILIALLLLFVLASCNNTIDFVGVENRNDTLLLYTETHVISVPLIDEHENYFFKHSGQYHMVSYVCSGYSYGEHAKGSDYVIYRGTKYYIK